ncbi:hypothetical protein HYH03_006230 [Edaphochlamys debaryana]|uniref:Transcription elongation factor SPT5 n=1 Tax=Edaphochlamys debaryana TaxID=47281 RepID=A0A835Y3Z5_9CHLO|nr:hypothetical protein HYH03_006230 [Edaphochlamys debaryana]|eukprot:KAG2495630.1 hypothetical protein HYH03_006230 [Edaphochlamys debaryana]
MGKKRGYDEDDDEVEEELEDEDADEGSDGEGPSKRKKRRGSAFIDEAAEEDDEEDEDEGDKKEKKKNRSVFIDDIADVDDEDEEEEIEEDAEDLIDDRDVEIPDAAAAPLNYRRMTREEDNAQEEDILRRIEERYKDYQGEDIPDTADTGVVGQQGLLPTPNDPKLWLCTCKAGHEREAVVQLLQKVYTMAERGTPLRILSAVALDHLPGFIYVEAAKESHVMDAIRGLRTVYVGKGAKLVPLNEMVDAVTVNRKAKDDMARDTWVRIRSGLYKDDLARVVDVDPVAGRVTLRLLHRLDFNQIANRTEEQRKKNPFGRAPTVRPVAKVFNPEEARVAGLLVQRLQAMDGMPQYQVLSHKFVGGYLLRTVGIKTVTVLDTLPGLEEVARFNAAATTGDDDSPATDLSSLMATLPTDGTAATKGTFMKGDSVRIVKGDLENLMARVTGVNADGTKVTAIPDIKGFAEEVEFEADELAKVFAVGQRVRVLAGQYGGDTGMVVRVADALCYLISDTSREEIKVFARDLTESDAVASGIEMLGEYQLHDLVQLNQATAGVVVKIEKDAARVLTNNGTPEQPDVRLCRLTDIQRKVTFKNKPVTQDQAGNAIREKDYVVIQTGRMRDRGGTVAYIWHGSLFLHCKDLTENGGYVAVRSFSTRLRGAGASGGPGASSNSARASAILGGGTPGSVRSTPGSTPGGSSWGGAGGLRYTPASPRPDDPSSDRQGGGMAGGGIGADGRFQMALPQRGGGGGMAGGPGGGRGGGGSFSGRSYQGGGNSQFIGKVVQVTKGPYNGYRGRVKQQTATHVQLELDAVAGRPVTVPMEYVQLGETPRAQPAGAGPATGYRGAPGGGGYGGPGGMRPGGDARYPPQTPSHPGLQTPAHYSMTPAHPSMTPSHAPYTPAHAPYTPAHHSSGENDDYYGDGDARHQPMTAPTPGYGGIAHTPQQAQALTPALTPQGFTPQEAMHAPTPADQHHGVAGTPNLAPTPGLARTPYLAAPTPGVEPAPTPGGAHYDGGGYTPGAHASTGTPGLTAPTPGLPSAYTPAFTPSGHIYGTPGTPGLDAGTPAVVGVVEDFGTWLGILVTLPGGGRNAVVRSASPDGTVSAQPGSYSQDTGFAPDGSAPLETHDARTLQVVRPSKRDKVKVIKAESADVLGVTGTLIGIDNADGIVKCDVSNDMKILDMTFLAKVVA